MDNQNDEYNVGGSLLEKCPRTSMWCKTNLEVRKVSFIWRINNFSLRPERVGQSIKSTTFSESDESKIKWSLRIYPNGINDNDKEFISIHIYLETSDRKEVLAKYKLALLNHKDVQTYKFCSTERFEVGKSWADPQHHKFVRKSRLNEELLSNDTLSLLCEISYSLEGQTHCGRNSRFSWMFSCLPNCFGERTKVSYESAKKTITEQIGELFYDPKYSDVTFIVDGHEFKAHKLILSVRSPVLAAMFAHPLKENLNNKVVIRDIDRQVFREMLRFIYTGDKYTLSLQMIAQLLSAADKYNLDDLKSVCQLDLISNISLETVCDLLLLADIHSAEHLKTKAIDYIKSNSKKVIKSTEWQKIVENPEILSQCFEAVVV